MRLDTKVTTAQGRPSPLKKRERPADADEIGLAGILTLADLQLALAPVLQGLQNVQERMRTVENQVSQKLDSTFSMVKTLDDRQKEQGMEIQKIASSLQNQEQSQHAQARVMKDVIARLEALEQKCTTTVWKTGTGMMKDEGGHGGTQPCPDHWRMAR